MGADSRGWLPVPFLPHLGARGLLSHLWLRPPLAVPASLCSAHSGHCLGPRVVQEDRWLRGHDEPPPHLIFRILWAWETVQRWGLPGTLGRKLRLQSQVQGRAAWQGRWVPRQHGLSPEARERPAAAQLWVFRSPGPDQGPERGSPKLAVALQHQARPQAFVSLPSVSPGGPRPRQGSGSFSMSRGMPPPCSVLASGRATPASRCTGPGGGPDARSGQRLW